MDIVENLIRSIVSEMVISCYIGSPASINSEMSKVMVAGSKYPAAIMFNEFPCKRMGVFSHNGVEAEITIYFMQLAGKTWNEKQHEANGVIPCIALYEEFKDLINNDVRFGFIEDEVITNRTNFGLIVQSFNTKQSVFPDILSGVEVNFKIGIRKNYC